MFFEKFRFGILGIVTLQPVLWKFRRNIPARSPGMSGKTVRVRFPHIATTGIVQAKACMLKFVLL